MAIASAAARQCEKFGDRLRNSAIPQPLRSLLGGVCFRSIQGFQHEAQGHRARAEEGGFWSEVPDIPGCAAQGETIDKLMANLHEAIGGCLAVYVAEPRVI